MTLGKSFKSLLFSISSSVKCRGYIRWFPRALLPPKILTVFDNMYSVLHSRFPAFAKKKGNCIFLIFFEIKIGPYNYTVFRVCVNFWLLIFPLTVFKLLYMLFSWFRLLHLVQSYVFPWLLVYCIVVTSYGTIIIYYIHEPWISHYPIDRYHFISSPSLLQVMILYIFWFIWDFSSYLWPPLCICLIVSLWNLRITGYEHFSHFLSSQLSSGMIEPLCISVSIF